MDPLSAACRIAVQFWAKVDMDSSGCWEWRAGRRRRGYGTFQRQAAHRVAWSLTNGPPGRMHVLHHCDNPPCVRPDHLFLGTHQDNMADRVAKGRSGHPKAGAASRRRRRGRSWELRAYAGVDPVTHKKHYVTTSVPVTTKRAEINRAAKALQQRADELAMARRELGQSLARLAG